MACLRTCTGAKHDYYEVCIDCEQPLFAHLFQLHRFTYIQYYTPIYGGVNWWQLNTICFPGSVNLTVTYIDLFITMYQLACINWLATISYISYHQCSGELTTGLQVSTTFTDTGPQVWSMQWKHWMQDFTYRNATQLKLRCSTISTFRLLPKSVPMCKDVP